MRDYWKLASYMDWVKLMILRLSNVMCNHLSVNSNTTLSCIRKSINVNDYPKGASYMDWVKLMILRLSNVMCKCLSVNSNTTLSCIRKSINVNNYQKGASYKIVVFTALNFIVMVVKPFTVQCCACCCQTVLNSLRRPW